VLLGVEGNITTFADSVAENNYHDRQVNAGFIPPPPSLIEVSFPCSEICLRRSRRRLTEAARRYLSPLIIGEAYPPYRNGLPHYAELRNVRVPKKSANAFRA
jgi:hypothetical protein